MNRLYIPLHFIASLHNFLPAKLINLMFMMNFLVLFFASLFILSTLQADARRLTMEGKRKLMAEGQLVTQSKNACRMANVSSNTDAKNAADLKNTPTPDAKTGSPTDDEGEGDDKNKSYGRYGNFNGSTPGNHHYCTNANLNPPQAANNE